MTSWFKRGVRWTETERIRQGSGPIDNLVVLIASMIILVIVGLGLAYYVYWWERPQAPKRPAEAYLVQYAMAERLSQLH